MACSDHRTSTFETIGLQTAKITVYDGYGNSKTVTSTVEVGNLYAGVKAR